MKRFPMKSLVVIATLCAAASATAQPRTRRAHPPEVRVDRLRSSDVLAIVAANLPNDVKAETMLAWLEELNKRYQDAEVELHRHRRTQTEFDQIRSDIAKEMKNAASQLKKYNPSLEETAELWEQRAIAISATMDAVHD